MKKDLILTGAFDRYNYGDLLFPLFLEKYIKEKRSDILDYYDDFIFVSMENKDLSNVGGVVTKSWSNLDKNSEKDVIVVGGDVLGASIEQMYMDSLNSHYKHLFSRILRKLSLGYYTKQISKIKFGINNCFPYVPINGEVGIKQIAYNTVSGSGFIRNDFELKDKNVLVERLNKATYISIRDESTLKQLNNYGVNGFLYPDSACIMSDLYPLSVLKDKVRSEEIRKIEDKNYIVFQFGLWHVKEKFEQIVEEINKIKENNDCEIVLLPVGFATNHDDLIALHAISKKLTFKHYLLDNVTIWEIMYVIGNAKFFFGTSLHGNITAMSYAVPHVGINKKIVKLDKYLKTWGITPFNSNIEVEEISNFYFKSKGIDIRILKENAKKLNKLVYENYDKLLNSFHHS